MPRLKISHEQRFWNKVDKTDKCWIWLGNRNRGYGQFSIGHHLIRAHRYSWQLINGPIPEGKQIDHICRNRSCVNPSHLEVVTQKENILRGISPSAIGARKTHCPRNHPYSGSNLIINGKGHRVCKSCREAHNKKRIWNGHAYGGLNGMS